MVDRSIVNTKYLRSKDRYNTVMDTIGLFFVIDSNGNTIGTYVAQKTSLSFARTFSDYVIFKILSGDYEGKELLIPKEYVNNTYLEFA